MAAAAATRTSSTLDENQQAASDDDEIRTLYDQDQQPADSDSDPGGGNTGYVAFRPDDPANENDPLLPTRSGAPDDSSSLVMGVFYCLGMATLLPWNFFISVNSFWDYKFRDVNDTGKSD